MLKEIMESNATLLLPVLDAISGFSLTPHSLQSVHVHIMRTSMWSQPIVSFVLVIMAAVTVITVARTVVMRAMRLLPDACCLQLQLHLLVRTRRLQRC